MAGIYIHIPFCRKACHYCAFHFSTDLSRKSTMLEAINLELASRAAFLQGDTVETIYLGGGTPSLLSAKEIDILIEQIRRHYSLANDMEITMEANPDDLSLPYLKSLNDHSAVNRLSIGVQSFHDVDLRFMNRAHDASHAHNAIQNALKAGYQNLSIDLIFGNPTTDDDMWHQNLKTAVDYQLDHLSLYALTVEEKTALASFIAKKKQAPIDDHKMERQFLYNIDYLEALAWEQYEISNFAHAGKRSRHNQSYWHQIPYLGIGPAAHSYKNGIRYHNIANNAKYINQMHSRELFIVEDKLSKRDQLNEYIMTHLRLKEGLQIQRLMDMARNQIEDLLVTLDSYISLGKVKKVADHYILTKKGKLFADRIASDLFITS